MDTMDLGSADLQTRTRPGSFLDRCAGHDRDPQRTREQNVHGPAANGGALPWAQSPRRLTDAPARLGVRSTQDTAGGDWAASGTTENWWGFARIVRPAASGADKRPPVARGQPCQPRLKKDDPPQPLSVLRHDLLASNQRQSTPATLMVPLDADPGRKKTRLRAPSSRHGDAVGLEGGWAAREERFCSRIPYI